MARPSDDAHEPRASRAGTPEPGPGGPGAPLDLVQQPDCTWARFTSTLAPRRLDVGGLSMLQYPASELDAGLANLWLIVDGVATPLLGPTSRGTTRSGAQSIARSGGVDRLDWVVVFDLVGGPLPGWRWRVRLTNRGQESREVSVVVAHDIALTPYAEVRINEYYVSQYLDLTPVEHADFGTALAVRQNMPGERAPWVAIASLDRGGAWATDALQLFDRRGGAPTLDPTRLPSSRWQHEHSLATLATTGRRLDPGEMIDTGFVAVVVDDHPNATGPQDAELINRARIAALSDVDSSTVFGLQPVGRDLDAPAPCAKSLFDGPVLTGLPADQRDLSRWFPGGRVHVESSPGGEPWAFTVGREHVVLPAKEDAVLRPHGHIVRTGSALTAETGVLTSTMWMDGVFTSQLTLGHVAQGGLLSGTRTYLGLQPAHGLRVFVEAEGRWQRLGQPSAWAINPAGARWCYRLCAGEIEVRLDASTEVHELALNITTPKSVSRTLIAMQLALGADDGQTGEGVDEIVSRDHHGRHVVLGGTERRLALDLVGTEIERVGGDELLFLDGLTRAESWCCLVARGPVELRFDGEELTGDQLNSDVVVPDLWRTWRDHLQIKGGRESSLAELVGAVDAQVPWFQHNAMVHYLSPRGLEQFTGGAWGTRDVCQGPIGLLSAMGRDDAVRDVLLRTFAAQGSCGEWPQAFDFLPTARPISHQVSHGDVIYWPLLALGDYLATTGDASILDELVTSAESSRTMAERLRLALDAIDAATLADSPLPAYGHGDWNDSLQPADSRLAENMVSSWTATLKVDMLHALAAGLVEAGRDDALARRCADLALVTQRAMLDQLLVDEELAGYGVTSDVQGGDLELLVHPRDNRTGLTHGILAWVHAIAGDQLSPEQAFHHLDLVRKHLRGPDGARLFDTPTAYRGGPMELFRRAEAASFWGREIGLMYTHAHLRYCQALARVGAADELLEALVLAVPTGLDQRIARARPRQSTCYFSSSDAVFCDRYDAVRRYPDLMTGKVDIEGGWRIYSSGPGLFLRLLVENVLGVRRRPDRLEFDPVLPVGLDGLEARVPLDDGFITLRYHLSRFEPGPSQRSTPQAGVVAVMVNGNPVPLTPLTNPYRASGVHVPRHQVPVGALVDVHLAGIAP